MNFLMSRGASEKNFLSQKLDKMYVQEHTFQGNTEWLTQLRKSYRFLVKFQNLNKKDIFDSFIFLFSTLNVLNETEIKWANEV